VANSNTLTKVPPLHRRQQKLMGNQFEIILQGGSPEEAQNHINKAIAEISRIERLLTTFNEDSQTNRVNRMAGIRPVKVDREVLDLIQRSLKISNLTQGAFDITYGSIDKKLWNFDTTMKALPSAEVARKMVRLINYKNVILDTEECTVFLAEKGMRIGFGGIGKGYAAEQAKAVLKQSGVENGIVNAAGDLTAWGHQSDGSPWTVGIADPNNKWNPFSCLAISEMAVATSGNYEKYITLDGKRYSHTIDPKTGLPVTGIKSVTIISPNAELSDSMATPVMVMGIKVGLGLINQIKEMECVIIDEDDRLFTSKNINLS